MANLLAYGENVIGSDVGSSGGHIIENSSGVDMTQRNKLQFAGNGVTITDDSTNDRTVVTISGGGSSSGLTILSYGTATWNDFVTAYNNNNVVFCKASITDSDPSSGTQSRHAVLSYVDDPANPTQAEFLYPKTTNRHDYNHQTDQMIVYTLDSTNGWSCTVRYTSTNISPQDGIAYTYNSTKGGTIYLSTPSITGSFSDAINYTVGDYVYYNNNLYKCTTAHTAGTWDASHFTQTTVGEELKNAGHKIINKDNTEMTKRNGLQFTGGLNVTDDSNNNRSVVDDNYEIIPWTTWQGYSDAEKAEHPNCVVTGAPDCDGTLEIENLHLAWTNPSPTQAFAANNIDLIITDCPDYDFVEWTMAFSISEPNATMTFKQYKGKDAYMSYGSASGQGSVSVQRRINYVSDTRYSVSNGAIARGASSAESTGNYMIPLKAKIGKDTLTAQIQAIARNVSTEASKCMLSGGNSVESAINRGKVSVTADGTKTYRQLFIELWALVNISKVTNQTVFTFNYNNSAHTRYIYPLVEQSDTYLVFSRGSANSSGARIESMQIDTTGAYLISTGSTRSDSSTQVPSSGWSFAIEY